MKKTGYWAMACLLAVITVFSGCASNGGKEAAEGTVRVLFASAVVDSSAAEEYASKLAERSDKIQAVECSTISLGNQSDPTMYMAGTMKVAAMVAGKEVDVIFFDRDAAVADARAETFYALDELFSADELAQMQDRLIRYHQVDTEGNELQEETADCGLDLSDDAELTKILNSSQVGVYVVGNAQNLEAVKALILSYLK